MASDEVQSRSRMLCRRSNAVAAVETPGSCSGHDVNVQSKMTLKPPRDCCAVVKRSGLHSTGGYRSLPRGKPGTDTVFLCRPMMFDRYVMDPGM